MTLPTTFLVAFACAAMPLTSALAQKASAVPLPRDNPPVLPAAEVVPSTGVVPATIQPSQAGTLKASRAAWKKACEASKGNYTYSTQRISWILGRRGGSRETVIVVRSNKVVERRYKETRTREPEAAALGQPPVDPVEVVQHWVEKGDDLGKKAGGEPLTTLDDLYARAEKLVAAYDAKHHEFETMNLRLDQAGLLQAAYVSNSMIADATPSEEGILVSTLTFDKAE